MSFLWGFISALAIGLAIFLLCFLPLFVAYIFYWTKGILRAFRLHSAAKRQARFFESDILDKTVSELKTQTDIELEASKGETLRRYSATNERFVDGLLQMTMRMIESVKVTTIERNVEEEVDFVLFKIGNNVSIKQISVAGMPVGRMFEVKNKSKITIKTDKIAETITNLYCGNIPNVLLDSLPDSDKLLSNGGAK